MKKPKFIQLYLDYFDHLRLLSEAQVGRLMMALFAYAQEEREPDFSDDQALQITFSFLRREVDKEFEAYRKMCVRNRENITKRYESKQNEKENEKENENEEENEHSPGARAQAPSCEEVVEAYHKHCKSLPRVKSLTKKRRQRIRAALPYLDGEGFSGVFQRVARSAFLCGGNGDWRADFDWILTPDNLTRILEGSFDNRASPASRSSYDIDALEQVNTLDFMDSAADGLSP